MRNLLKLFSLLSLLLAFGCATRKEVVNLKNDSFYIRSQIDSLRAEQRRLRTAIVKLTALTEQSAEANSRLRADIQVQLNQLGEQSQILNDRLEETGRRISNLPSKLRLSPPAVAPNADTTNNRASRIDTAQVNAAARKRLDEAQRLYDSAYQDFVKGQYALAQQGFRQFLQMLPESELADNAQYWIGECNYSQKKYAEAIQAFQIVISQYADGEKVPAAMLKLSYAQIAAGKTQTGKDNLETLIKRFPQSQEANLARARLQELQK
jgi:tol-pal system protein YbgF